MSQRKITSQNVPYSRAEEHCHRLFLQPLNSIFWALSGCRFPPKGGIIDHRWVHIANPGLSAQFVCSDRSLHRRSFAQRNPDPPWQGSGASDGLAPHGRYRTSMKGIQDVGTTKQYFEGEMIAFKTRLDWHDSNLGLWIYFESSPLFTPLMETWLSVIPISRPAIRWSLGA